MLRPWEDKWKAESEVAFLRSVEAQRAEAKIMENWRPNRTAQAMRTRLSDDSMGSQRGPSRYEYLKGKSASLYHGEQHKAEDA